MTLAAKLSPESEAVAQTPSFWLARPEFGLWAIGFALVVLQAAGAAAQLADAVRVNVAVILLQGVAYLLAVRLVARGASANLAIVLSVSAILRLTLLFLPPFLSDDIFRYIWDGRVQGAGINPYLYIPNDPALAGLRDADIWPHINRADYAPTIYPPVAQALFFLITRVSDSVVAMKAAWVLFEGVMAWGLVRLLEGAGQPKARLLIFAWCPLGVWETAGSGHLDAAMAAFVVLALWARMRGQDGFAGAALGLAALVKFFPLVIAPALWRRWDWRLPAAFAAVVVVCYLPYLGAGSKVLGFLSGYSHEEGLASGKGFWVVNLVLRTTGLSASPLAYVALTGLLLAGLALVLVLSRDPGRAIPGGLALAAVGMIALSPNHPWYFVWLAPFLCFRPEPALLWLVAAAPLLYWPNPFDTPWNADIVYGGVFLLALIGLYRRRSRLYSALREHA